MSEPVRVPRAPLLPEIGKNREHDKIPTSTQNRYGIRALANRKAQLIHTVSESCAFQRIRRKLDHANRSFGDWNAYSNRWNAYSK